MSDRRLLIIDDEPEIAAIISNIAKDCGFSVRATTSAVAFAEAYSNFKPTAIILDLAVPDTDGIELLRWLADKRCAIPILILSGFGDRVVEAAKRLGEARGLVMGGVLTKPMRAADIRHVLEGLTVVV